MSRASRIGTIGSLTVISLISGVLINRAIAQVGSDQPVKNPGISGINSPAPTNNGGVTDQPITNPGVSGTNNPTPGLSQPNPTVDGTQPVTNPGTSGISTSGSTVDGTQSTNSGTSSISIPGTNGSTGGGTQPITNPGTSGISTPGSTGSGTQPVTNPGTSGISTPGLTPTQPNQPDTTRTIVAPNGIPDVIIRQQNRGTTAPTTQRTTQPGRTQTPQPQQAPAPRDNGTTTGFIKTAISNQLASNPNTQKLDAQLLQATCSQNWQGAIAIVDRALESAPANQTYRSQLQAYRSRLQTLANARTAIPNWSQKCTGG